MTDVIVPAIKEILSHTYGHSQSSPLYSNPDPKPLIGPVGLSLAATAGSSVVEPGRAPVGLVDGDETGRGHALAQLQAVRTVTTTRAGGGWEGRGAHVAGP